ncbi:MAG: transcriptional regulator [Candidatus Nitrohelix vancouverensis]|uniref:Transcriptional regulator n=1 Tax=Candidatus Nitrohelix vancouverensis TaxID=2705534 RepID=A0A7T0G266_9BACT|nr:MAG: transcriptional regulator [Candidatus Nitrohelix vancouverensis]
MAITKNFKETIQARALRDPEFRHGLLKESIESMLAGDPETGKMILRDYINATIGFEKLGVIVQKSPKSLMRMFSPSGNPTANNLFGIIHTLQKKEGVHFEVKTTR